VRAYRRVPAAPGAGVPIGWPVVSSAVEISSLVVEFGARRAVDQLDLALDYGEVVALLGPNGAGKTTAVETLLGFRVPSAGSVRLHGRDPVRDHAEVVARTGALLQRGGVWFPMTPRQALELTAAYYDAPRDVDELVALLALATCASTPWRRLSGGEQQRTLLALALVGRPRALVLDEPTAAVDPEGRQVVRQIVRTEAQRGCAILITTHELAEAERLADRVAILNHGRCVAAGTLVELGGPGRVVVEVADPLDPAALAARLGCMVEAEGPRTLRVDLTAPDAAGRVTAALAELGATLVALRTRATLEERYLDLVAESREELA
jgi:ABC-2 type transport system ATP-binding protein